MNILERIEWKVAKWLQSRALERALRRWGGCQVCPWCKQWAQLHDGWHFDSATDRTIDALHCGNCGGVSRWRFELGMMPLDPIGLTPPPVKCAAPASEPSWRCFHCGEVFTKESCARAHFGADETYEPVCQIASRDGGLVRALREAEASALEAHQQAHDESGDALNAWRAAVGRYERRIIDAEQAGYDKGVTDMRAELAARADGAFDLVKVLAAHQTTAEMINSPVARPVSAEDRLREIGERIAKRDQEIMDARAFLGKYQVIS